MFLGKMTGEGHSSALLPQIGDLRLEMAEEGIFINNHNTNKKELHDLQFHCTKS